MNNGMVEAWTGVMRFKPMLDTASRTHSAKEGVRTSQAREEEVAATSTCAVEAARFMAKVIPQTIWNSRHGNKSTTSKCIHVVPELNLSLSPRDIYFYSDKYCTRSDLYSFAHATVLCPHRLYTLSKCDRANDKLKVIILLVYYVSIIYSRLLTWRSCSQIGRIKRPKRRVFFMLIIKIRSNATQMKSNIFGFTKMTASE